MAWETRRQHRYFYLNRRAADGRARKVYLGRGPAAAAAAQRLAVTRAAREADAQAVLGLQMQLQPLDAAMDELDNSLAALTELFLASAGYHEHRGWWRRRRLLPGKVGTP